MKCLLIATCGTILAMGALAMPMAERNAAARAELLTGVSLVDCKNGLPDPFVCLDENAFGVFAVPQAEREAAFAELTKGVKAIDAPGGALPGGFILIGEDVFPIAECRNYDGTTAFAAAGAFYGKGRALVLSHGNFTASPDFKFDTRQLFLNALRWQAPGKVQPKVAALRNDGIVRMAKALGLTDVTRLADVKDLKGFDILISSGLEREDVAPVLDFIRAGGGFIGGSLGWGFMFFHKDACFAEDFPENRLLGTLGLIMGSTGVNRVGQGFPVLKGAPRKGTLVDEAIALAVSGGADDKAVRPQVAKTLSDLMNGLPSGVRTELYGRLIDITKRPEANLQPSPERPLGAESLFARLAVLARKNAYLANPESVPKADPTAAVYPGLVTPGTPPVTREVPIDLTVPRWHSTGVFSPAGQALTVKIDPAAIPLGLKVRIGTTADDLSGLSEWKRFPLVTMELKLTKAETTFASPFGGLVYIVVPNNKTGTTRVTLSGGVMAPWFKLGRDTDEAFAKECAESGSPWGEIEANGFIITSETRGLKRVKSATWIAEFWDRAMALDLELACWEKRTSPERICADVQLTCGWLHDGYPLMSHINEEHFDWAIDRDELESGGGWGVFHEIGHNHQNREWTPDGTGEVTVNLFTMYNLETLTGANMRDMRYPCGAAQAKKRVRNWVNRGKKFSDWKGDYFLALETYLRIREAYGWDAFKKTFARYRQPGFRHPRTTEEIWDTFARELSATVNADMGAVLAEWSIPLSKSARDFCAKYPPAKSSLTEGLVKREYAPPATNPVDGDYLSFALSGPDAGEFALYGSRDDIPGGERDRRWKTTHLLFRRIAPSEGPVTLGRVGGRETDYEAPHEVEITRPYYIGVYELTQEQYFRIMGEWRDYCFGTVGDRETRPVQGISYDQTRGSIGEGIDWPATGHRVAPGSILGRLRELASYRAEFDLPTEAQWEYAGRAGVTNEWNSGETGKGYQDPETKFHRNTALDKLGRYHGNGGSSPKPGDPLMQKGVKTPFGTAPVGSYAPNAWGLYDFHGNVFEHCLDYLRSVAEAKADYSGKDPVGPRDCGVNKGGRKNDARRAMRGGTWWNYSFGSADGARIWSRGLGGCCGTGTGHEATGLRLALPAALAPHPVPGPDAEALTAEQLEIRRRMIKGVTALDSKGLPGPVYTLTKSAFPLIAAKTWESSAACLVAVGTCGEGRVAVWADDAIDPSLGDNARFLDNLGSWLTEGSKVLGLFRREAVLFDLSTLPDEPAALAAKCDEIEGAIRDGAGYLFYGRAWPWRQKTLKEKGRCRVSDWPGNVLLKRLGFLVGDFCVRRTAGASGWSAYVQCGEGAAVAPSTVFDVQKAPKDAEPLVRPLKERGREGILVRDGESIAFLGDSITRLGAGGKGYINLVLSGLEAAGVRNVGKVPAGCDGQNAPDMAGRIGSLIGNPEVKLLTISCGVNDIWGYDWSRGVTLEEYSRAVRRMYDKAAAAGVQVVAMTPTLMREEPDNEYNRLLDTFADFIRAEAERRGLPLADCRRAELEGLKAFPPNSGRHFTYDGVHPVWEGHKLIAREILKALGVPAKYDQAIEDAWRQIGGIFDLKVSPAGPRCDNIKGYTSFCVRADAGAFQRRMFGDLRSRPNWRLTAFITDETVGNRREFCFGVNDLSLVTENMIVLPTGRNDYVPLEGHEYTIELIVYEGGDIRARGVSEKGAFKIVDRNSDYARHGRLKAEVNLRGRPHNPLTNKSVLFAGDDLMAATCETKLVGLSPIAGWAGRIGWANNLRWLNVGQDGATVAFGRGGTIYARMEEGLRTPFDLVILEGGLVDALTDVEIGSPAPGGAKDYHMPKDPEKTFASALERTLWRVSLAKDTKAGFVIPPRFDDADWKGAAARFGKLVPVIRAACEKWGVAYLDLWNDSSVTATLRPGSKLFSADGLHLNNRGYDATYPYVQQFAEAILSGAAQPGASFTCTPVAYAEPAPEVVTSADANVAAGKPAYTVLGGWQTSLTDGRKDVLVCFGGAQERHANLNESDCYAEIDLGDLYEIDKVRIFPGSANLATRYRVVVTEDAKRPAGAWRTVWEKQTDEMNTPRGFSGSFKGAEAKYVRVYGLSDRGVRSAGAVEIEVFGRISPKAGSEHRFYRRDRLN